MRISAKADYAIRALVELASEHAAGPVKGEHLARRQDIPARFLLGILTELKHAHLVRSTRGAEGGFSLARDAAEITLADVIRVIDGPLYNVRDSSLDALEYPGSAAPLRDVWMAVRSSLRSVLEAVTIADLAGGSLPPAVQRMADDYRATARPGR